MVDAAKKFAASVGVETADDQRFEAAQRARVDAEHILDDVSTLKMRKTLGPERWDKLLREASESLEAAKIQETRAQTHKRVNRRVWLSDAFDHLTPEQQRSELRTLVRCVMVEAGDGPLADRLHVLLADNPVEVCRGGDPGRGLAATVQDPYWMLARQQQFGELTGADGGMPVQVAFQQTEWRLDGWKPTSGPVLPYSPQADVVEALVAGEAAGPAQSTLDRLQAGRALAGAVSSAVAAQLRSAFALPITPDSPRLLVRGAAMFADGLAVAAAFTGAAGGTNAELATALKLAIADATAARADLADFARWCAITFGTGPSSWIPERLERRFELAVSGSPVLTAPGHAGERVDWHDFDVAVTAAGTPTTVKTVSRTRVPTNIQFPDQPRDRFWEFEDATLSLSRIDATTNDLGRLALVEFSTLYGNDWFTFPIPISYGSLQAVSELVVRDSFGTHELIAPAADSQWAMYRPTGAALASLALVVPSVTAAPLAGDIVEEVCFLRDEMAALVWAVEQIVTDADGTRHDLPDEYLRAVVGVGANAANADLTYRLMTDVPEHWVPFIPVQLAGSSRQVGLVEAVLPPTASAIS